MWGVEARSLDRLAVVRRFGVLVVVMPYFLQAMVISVVSMWMSMRMSKKMKIWMRIWMRVSYAPVFGILRPDAGAADFLTKIPFRSACISACCICFPAHVA